MPGTVLCGECIAAGDADAIDTRDVGARTAALCEACGRDGAAARWSEANRGAGLWKALVLAFDGIEVDPMSGYRWDEPKPGIALERPGLRCTEPQCICTVRAADTWGRVFTLARG